MTRSRRMFLVPVLALATLVGLGVTPASAQTPKSSSTAAGS